MARVVLVDDHEIVRRGVAELLGTQDDFDVVGEAGSVAEALDLIRTVSFDLAVLDLRLPDGSGVELCREYKVVDPLVRCLILTSHDDEQGILAAALAGADGYLRKDVRGTEILDAVRRIARGENLIDDQTKEAAIASLTAAPTQDPLAELTDRERLLLGHIAQGKTNRQIAGDMYIAEKTVKNYVSTLLLKLGMSSRTEAAVFAVRLEQNS